MILDIENEFIKGLIDKRKHNIEKSILDGFECKVEVLNVRRDNKDITHEILIYYVCKEDIKKDTHIATKMEIKKSDLISWKMVDKDDC